MYSRDFEKNEKRARKNRVELVRMRSNDGEDEKPFGTLYKSKSDWYINLVQPDDVSAFNWANLAQGNETQRMSNNFVIGSAASYQ
jgi:hypothetical protein